MLRRLAGLGLCCSVLCTAPRAADACTCVDLDIRSFALTADVVFEGTALDGGQRARIPDFTGDTEPATKYTFAVARYYKGYLGSTATVHVPFQDDCTKPSFRRGMSRLIFAHWRDEQLVIESCSGTNRSHDDLSPLGEGAEPAELADFPSEGYCALAWKAPPTNSSAATWLWALVAVAAAWRRRCRV